jgi:soluble lytic murein transglycosylase
MAAALVPAARHLGLDPALVYAVMRRESRFDARARSGAGARGLLQLRPSTADRMAALLHLGGDAGNRVDEPALNLTLGTHYLALLASRFGDPVVALAAYNAGPAAAEGWARARAGQPLDVWVESIPYRETREYVKIVAGEWDVYRALDGEPAAPVDPAHPVPAPGPGVSF